MRVTCGVPTKNRYEQLAQTLQSVAMQTHKDMDVIVVDDSDEPKDLRDLPQFRSIFRLFDQYKIGWRVIYGQKRGQHISHQVVQEESPNEFIWRIDDDEIAEPNVLETLLGRAISLGAGAVGGLVLIPPPGDLPKGAKSEIGNPNENIQWYSHNGSKDSIPVDHLHSTFLYKKGLADYELGLSPVAHREETIFTHQIKRTGNPLYVVPTARTWHLRADTGGIRSHQNPQFWEDDEKLFQSKLSEWGVTTVATKVCVLDAGKGDHVVFKSILPEIVKKYEKVIVASCYDDVFHGEQIELISIADAQVRYGNLDRFNIYRKMIDWNWKGSLQDAFRKLYL